MARPVSGTRDRERFALSSGRNGRQLVAFCLSILLGGCSGTRHPMPGTGGASGQSGAGGSGAAGSGGAGAAGVGGLPPVDGTCTFDARRISDGLASASPASPALVSSEDGYGVAWMDYRSLAHGVYFVGLGLDGSVSHPEREVVATEGSEIALARAGQGYALLRGDTNGAFFSRLGAGGEPDGMETSVSPVVAPAGGPWLVQGGDGFGAAWATPDATRFSLRFARLYGTGSVSATAQLAENGFEPRMVWTGDGFGAVWTDRGGGALEVYFQERDAEGNPRADALRISRSDGGESSRPLIAFGDGGYAVAWSELGGGQGERVYLQRLGRDGRAVAQELTWSGSLAGLTFGSGRFAVIFASDAMPAPLFLVEMELTGAPRVKELDGGEPMTGTAPSVLVANDDALALAWVGEGLGIDFATLDCP
jgi:hypothetical protein